MTVADRWLLPEGVEEILPGQAMHIETLRRRLLDLYHSWGYELVMPPLIEYRESLLIGLGNDMDLQSFKLTDQLSGRTLAIRADITPQTARIDAHSWRREGNTRLCYAGTVLHTRPKALMASRSPIETGAELYGEVSLEADVEVICLMLETLALAGLGDVHLDLGHVGIYRALAQVAQLAPEIEQQLFDALQRKASAELATLVQQHVGNEEHRCWLLELARFHGDESCLREAALRYQTAPAAVGLAIADLQAVAAAVQKRVPGATCYFDLGELRGYHYHTGLVFAAFVPGQGRAVANGGRYDNVGAVFGRARPATGFSTDLKTLARLGQRQEQVRGAILAPALVPGQEDYWSLVARLRQQGERVVVAMSAAEPVPEHCDRCLTMLAGQWQVAPLTR